MAVEKVLVVGLGLMGRGILQVCAQAGFESYGYDVNEEAVKKAKKILTDAGFPEANIQGQTKQEKVGIARDIVSEAQKLKADMIILGRRGLSGIKEFFLGSVSQKVLQLAKDKSVLLVQ